MSNIITKTEELIGPERAKELLDKLHPGQRSVVKNAVGRYAAAMTAGTWDLVPHGIVLDADGHLVDGQHRMLAVIQSKTEQMFTVSVLPKGASLKGIDRGKSRSHGHIMEITGMVDRGQGRAMACYCRALYSMSVDRYRVDDFESIMSLVVEENGEYIQNVVAVFPRIRSATSWVVAAMAYAYPCNPDSVTGLLRAAIQNDRLVKQSPAWHLHQLIHSLGSSSNLQALDNAYKILRVIQAEFEGQNLQVIKSRPSGPGKENYEPTSLVFFKELRKKAGLKDTVI